MKNLTFINVSLTPKMFLFLLSFLSISAFAQNITVKGTVKDGTGEVVIGGSVLVKGTTNGSITDLDGNYTLSNVPANGLLEFSYIGMKKQEVKVEGKSIINVTLVEDSQVLNEVVVTALGMKREQKALGYAVTELKGDAINSNAINPVSSLQGKVAGVEISNSDGGIFGSAKIQIRGNSTLGSNNQPIYVVDGVILDNGTQGREADGENFDPSDYGNELKNLNPDDFETISVFIQTFLLSKLFIQTALIQQYSNKKFG